MHELSLAVSMIEQIENTLQKQSSPEAKVEEITLEIGTMSGVDRDAFEFVFPVASKGSRCDGARLVFDEKILKYRCNKCNQITETETAHILCSKCSSVDVDILSGRHFRLMSMEVNDV